MLTSAREELKATKRQKIREVMKHPAREALIEETYEEMETELDAKITGLQNQIALPADRRNTIIRTNRVARTALELFDAVLNKETLDKRGLELIIDRILIYEDHLEIKLKQDIDTLLALGSTEETVNFSPDTRDIEKIATGGSPVGNRIVQSSTNRKDKVFRVLASRLWRSPT